MSEEKPRKKHHMNPKSLANLIPHKKGQPSYNPHGRPPKDKSLTEACRRKVMDGKTGKRPTVEVLAESIVKRALCRHQELGELWDRLEGTVVQESNVKVQGDVTWIIGKGYADSQPSIQTDKQDPK